MDDDPSENNNRLPNTNNNTVNPNMITAEQLLQRAFLNRKKPQVEPGDRIRDEDDLNEIKWRKRKKFENKIRQQRFHIEHWIKFADFEESFQELRRARSVYERALEVDYKNISLWLKYIEMEMRHKFINHARNIFERAIDLLPSVDQLWLKYIEMEMRHRFIDKARNLFERAVEWLPSVGELWYKYAFMEEMISNFVGARRVFERWMEQRPEEKAWLSYLAFEKRMGEVQNARQVMYKYMDAFPCLKTYLKVIKFELKLGFKQEARQLYEKTLEELDQEALQEEYFINFAKFEISNLEYDRAREIFKFGLENIPYDKSKELFEEYLSFKKQYGTKDDIDELIFNERRLHYMSLIYDNKMNYDAWFDLVNLEIATGNIERTRDTFEHAVKNVPLTQEKRLWRRYIYLWYNYANFEEMEAKDYIKAKDVYERILQIVPHDKFTFSKLWIMYAHFQERNKNFDAARKVFDTAIGKCPNDKLFREYIDLEYKFANIDQVRKIYEKYVEEFPDNPDPYIQWAQLERSLPEIERYKTIFELAINRPTMNMPEKVWKAYIDNEIELEEYENSRSLFEEFLKRYKNVKIWISYADFEAKIDDREKCRAVYSRAEEHFKTEKQNEERAMVLECWKRTEYLFGDTQFINMINDKQPNKIRRKIIIAEGDIEEDADEEENYDYIFPGEEDDQKLTKILTKEKQRELEKNLRQEDESVESQ